MIDDTTRDLLENFLEKEGMPGLELVLATTSDAILRGYAYRDVTKADQAEAERLAAAATSLMQLARAVLREHDDDLLQLPVEGARRWLFIIVAGENSYLLARASRDIKEIGKMSRALHKIAGKLGDRLEAIRRREAAARMNRLPSGTAGR